MAAADDIFKRCDARLHECFINVFAQISWWRSVERQITTLSADDEFLARESLLAEFFQRDADRALAALKTIIRGAIDHVTAKLDRANDGVCIAHVGRRVGVAEIGTDPDG